jgi:uncharacterized protein (TIGR03435 family)
MKQKYLARACAVTTALAVGSLSGVLLAQAPAGQTPVGQTPAIAPAFEVATIRAAPSMMDLVQQIQSGKAKIGMSVDGARVDMGFSSLADLIRIAYGVKPYQVQGPDWMAQQRFEIQAKIPEGVSQDKVPEMLQALLAERFRLAIHRDKKELPIYALIVGKNGPKLTEASTAPDAPLPDSPGTMSIGTEKGQMKMAQDGKGGMVMQGGGQTGTIKTSVSGTGIHLEMTKVTLAALVDTLTPMVDRPVLDLTELKGTYQIALDLPLEDMLFLAQKQMATLGLPMPGPPPGAGANPADAASTPGGSAIFAAMEKLGLKLDSRKAPVETIVVDHLEKTPTEN